MYSREWWEMMDAMCYRMQEHLDDMLGACEARTASAVPENPSHDECKIDFINGCLGLIDEAKDLNEGLLREEIDKLLPEL